MDKPSKRSHGESVRTLGRSTLGIGIAVVLAFSLLLGVTAGAMGLASIYPSINQLAQPFACPGRTLTHSQQISEVGSSTYYAAKWYCIDPITNERTEADSVTVYFAAGLLHGLIIFALLIGLIYLYWNSSIGPAKNDGLKLW